jgi:glycosyltransferase involved in cell wall biosynthesis
VDARVTIGVIVFNGARTLRRAVQSILDQSYRGISIHISDDASEDASGEIGEALAAENKAVNFIRQSTNLGPANNFRYLLKHATTEYFMWLAADDYLKPTFVEETMGMLDADPRLVASISKVLFVDRNGGTRLSEGTRPLVADPLTNLAIYLSGPADNARQYALYRTIPLQRSFPLSHFHAYDWAAVAGTLLYGKHGEISEVLMIRDETPNENYIRSVRTDNLTSMGRIFPLLPMTTDLIFRQRVPITMKIIKAFLNINIEAHMHYMSVFHPRYGYCTKNLRRFWRRHIAWRLMTLG